MECSTPVPYSPDPLDTAATSAVTEPGSPARQPNTADEGRDTLPMLRAALASSLGGVAVCDRFRRIVLTNDALDGLFGYATNELLRRDITTILPDLTFASATVGESNGVRKDGAAMAIKVGVTPVPGREPLFVVSVIDLSD